jgi:probable HAF family extracellular repeat protein
MKFAKPKQIAAISFFTLLVLPVQLAAQDKQDHQHMHHHYQLIDLGTFGGPNANFITQGVGAQVQNSRGVVTGSADTSIPDPNAPNCLNPLDCFISHAFKWRKGSLTDLGALPGVNSSFGSWISANGLIAGESGNGEIDPLTGGPEERAVLWKDGHITDLGTFGGNESWANAVNNRGHVVGSAANAVPDPFNSPPFLYGWGTQMHAFLREDGARHDLGTLGGPDNLALYVNEAGQVAGFSYTSYTPNQLTGVPPGHPFLWENGTMHDLGTIGGTQVFDLDGLNERGQVIGQMTMADEVRSHPFFWDGKKLIDLGTFGGNGANANWFNEKGEIVGHSQYATDCPVSGQGSIDHAYLWRNGLMTDLGTVPGINPLEGLSSAWGINSKTQIVGNSATCDFSILVAFLWENGSMVDLNTLIPANASLQLFNAIYISDRGEITGFGILANGDVHDFLLIPCDETHADVEGCDHSLVDASATAESPAPVVQEPTITAPRTNNVGRMPRRRLRPLSHMPVPMSGSPSDQETPISRDSQWQLQDKLAPFDHAEPAADSSSKSSCDAAQPPQRCIPLGGACFGPRRPHCCPAPFPHHSLCSSRTGWGRCLMT